MHIGKAGIAIDRFSIIWKSYLSDKIKPFHCYCAEIFTTIVLDFELEKMLDGKCTRMPHVVLKKLSNPQNKSCLATYLLSHKPSTLHDSEVLVIPGKAETNS